jgi:Flp pilus assembly protein TadB
MADKKMSKLFATPIGVAMLVSGVVLIIFGIPLMIGKGDISYGGISK